MLINFLGPGLLLGLAVALSPGPIMALLLSETLRHGVKGGLRIAVAPLFTDIPFIIVAISIANGVSISPIVLGTGSLLGGCFLLFLAWLNITVHADAFRVIGSTPSSLWKGITVNLLNPYLYLFWFSVATPIFARGNIPGSLSFSAGFLITAVGTMCVLAVSVAMLRSRVIGCLHWVIRGIGVVLAFFALTLLRDGFHLLGFSLR